MTAITSKSAIKVGRSANAIQVIATTVGVIFGLSGFNHGLFEFLQGNKPTGTLVIRAIGEGQRFWPLGTEEAFTIVPNFLVTGLLSMIVGLVIVVWSLRFLGTERGPTVFLILFVLLFLVGGGIGQIAFFIPAWAFVRRMDGPLARWRKTLPRRWLPVLSRIWLPLLVLASVFILVGLEIAIFGYIPGMTEPERIQNTAMLLVLSSALMYLAAFVAGIAYEIRRGDQQG